MSDGRADKRLNGRVLVLHEHGGTLHALCARRSGERGVEVEWAESAPASDEGAGRRLIKRGRGASLVEVVPGASTVCRCVDDEGGIGRLDPGEASSALDLLSEGELGSSVASHRRAAGLVAFGSEHARRERVLVSAWPGGPLDEPIGHDPDAAFVSEGACWAVLASGGEVDTLAMIDSGSGETIVVAGGPVGAMVRAIPLESPDGAEGAIAETRARVGLEPGDAGAPDAVFEHDGREIRIWGRLTTPGVGAERGWLASYGGALGGAMAALDQRGLMRPLVSLHETGERRQQSPAERAVAMVATPTRAAIIVGVCVAVLVLWPLAVAFGRNVVLGMRAGGGPEVVKARLVEGEQLKSKYGALSSARWPVTKLLADVSGAAPEGVVVQSVELRIGEGLTVSGSAASADELTRFVQNLEATRIFSGVNTPNRTTEDGRERFVVRAKLLAPRYRAEPAEDYAGENGVAIKQGWDSLADAMAGSGPSSSGRASRPSSSSRRTSTPSEAGSSGAGRETVSPGAVRGAEAALPDPVSDADIAAMDRETAMKEWTSRQAAARKADDETVKARLTSEAEKCKQRFLSQKAGS